VRQVVIWKRAGGLNFSPTFYLPTHEWILILAKKAFRLKSKAASGAKDVWEITQERGNPHPAPFPVELPRKAIETTTAKVILDPFAGSGSTLAAAVLEGRKAIGIELEERWCEYTANRLRTLEDECSKLAA
jgi:modification methylase